MQGQSGGSGERAMINNSAVATGAFARGRTTGQGTSSSSNAGTSLALNASLVVPVGQQNSPETIAKRYLRRVL